MTTITTRILRPDSKGRISVGAFIENGLSGFRVSVDELHRIILEPLIEKPRYPHSKMKGCDLKTLLENNKSLSPEEAENLADDLDHIRRQQTLVRNAWES